MSKAHKLTRLKTKREIVEEALELLLPSESRKASFGTMRGESGKVI